MHNSNGTSKVDKTVRLPDELAKDLAAIKAARPWMSTSALISEAVAAYVAAIKEARK